MELEWLNEVIRLLEFGGIPGAEAFPGGEMSRLQGPAAAVSLLRADQTSGIGEISVRVLSPRKLGLWACQKAALRAMELLTLVEMTCRLEPVTFEEGCDCFCVEVRASFQGLVAGSWLSVQADGTEIAYVTEFSAEQDRGRRLIGGVNQFAPVGITTGTGGWKFRLVRKAPTFDVLQQEPGEPFELTVEERETVTRFTGCGLNRVKKTQTREGTLVEWEGFALTREVTVGGEAEL